jgi:RDD family
MSFLRRFRQRPALSGGALRRLIAFIVDIVLVSILGSLLAPIPYALSDGSVRIAGNLHWKPCVVRPATDSEQQAFQAGRYGNFLHPDFIKICQASILGYPTDGSVTFVQNNEASISSGKPGDSLRFSANAGTTLWLKVPMDARGRLTTAIYIDFLIPLFLLFYAVLMENRFGATIGKLLMNLRLRQVGGEWAVFPAVLTRQLWRLGPLVLTTVTAAVVALSLDGLVAVYATLLLQAALGGWMLFGVLNYVLWRPDPLFDRKVSLTVSYTKPSWMAEN